MTQSHTIDDRPPIPPNGIESTGDPCPSCGEAYRYSTTFTDPAADEWCSPATHVRFVHQLRWFSEHQSLVEVRGACDVPIDDCSDSFL